MIKVTINGKTVEVKEGSSILDAARLANIKIPTLCKHPDLEASGGCGLCIVKIKGLNKMLRACTTEVTPNMEVTTHDPELVSVRRTVLELIMSNHPQDCLTCARNQNCELQSLCAEFGIRENHFPNILSTRPQTTAPKASALTLPNAYNAGAAYKSARRCKMSGLCPFCTGALTRSYLRRAILSLRIPLA